MTDTRDALHAAISACSEVYGDDDERTKAVRDIYDRTPTSDTEDVGEERLSDIVKRNARQRREIEESDPRFVSDEVRAMVDDVAWLLARLRRTPETVELKQIADDLAEFSSNIAALSRIMQLGVDLSVVNRSVEKIRALDTQDPNAGGEDE